MSFGKSKLLEWRGYNGDRYTMYAKDYKKYVSIKGPKSRGIVDIVTFEHLINIILDSEPIEVVYIDSSIKANLLNGLSGKALDFKNMKYAHTYAMFFNKGESKRYIYPNESAVLGKIAHLSKMDCWFSIIRDKDGHYYTYDLEERNRIPLSTGIQQLEQGMTRAEDYRLSTYEQILMIRVFHRMGVDVRKHTIQRKY